MKQLIEAQLRLECIGLNAEDLLERIPGPNPDDIPRFYIVRHHEGYSLYFRYDLSSRIREQIGALSPKQAFGDHETIKRFLAQDAQVEAIWAGKSYIFPNTLTPADYADVTRLDGAEGERPVYAVLIDGQIVAACESSRENDAAAEAWVQTLLEFRRRGYACQVTAAWAHDLLYQGKLPFYSHKLDNLASQGVARSLGLIHFIDAVAYS